MSIAYSLSSTSITVIINFTPRVVPSSHPNFTRIVDALKRGGVTEAELLPLLDVAQGIANNSGGAIVARNGKLYLRGFELKSGVAKKINEFLNSGQTALAAPLLAFLERAVQNPDPRATSDLFDWLQASGLPITSDGFVLAWKAVDNNYMSIHSGRRGKLSHKLGETVSEPREECDDNPDRTCSAGLHFCAADYLKNYSGGGSRIVVVKIDPADVVAFPRDYGLSKGRACRYQVVGEVPYDQVKTFYPQGQQVYTGFDRGYVAPTPTTPRLGKFAVGQVWATRSGQRVTITSITHSSEYPVLANNGSSYTSNGAYYGGTNSRLDLVSLISDVA